MVCNKASDSSCVQLAPISRLGGVGGGAPKLHINRDHGDAVMVVGIVGHFFSAIENQKVIKWMVLNQGFPLYKDSWIV